MPIYYDQLNRRVDLPSTPKRIISIVPSQTELLFSLGLDKEVVGITKFCTHPAAQFKSTTKVGGTKQLNIAQIKQLRPDLIIANKEENERSQVEELMSICPVWISDISDLSGALTMIERVGAMVGREPEANELCRAISHRFDKLTVDSKNLTVAYLIWRKPYMVAGTDTFINSMLRLCGLTNAFNAGRYPEVTDEMLINAKPDVVFLSSEPYPFTDKHIREFKKLLPGAVIRLVDGEMFSWYGSRLLLAPGYFEELMEGIHK
ncbi:helical backbone metal receptor [soil metagenome]|jgi:ABC-type Fe3+-hydroxamate transport system substrate-binding protein